MRIGFVISTLGRGGAELQMLQLAAGLVDRGHDVSMVAYGGGSDIDEEVRHLGIALQVCRARNRFDKVHIVRRWLMAGRFDVAHAFLNTPSVTTLLARLPYRTPPVVVTDFSAATYRSNEPAQRMSLAAYAFANRVVTETETNRRSIARVAPWLIKKTKVIRNGVDVDRFRPCAAPQQASAGPFVFCAVGTVYGVKNPMRVIDAVAHLVRRGVRDFRVEWYGRFGLGGNPEEGERAVRHAAELRVSEHIAFLGDTVEIERAYHRADALLHVSLREGFPNVVAEGMACGLPVVVSNVSDLPYVVREAANGYVVDEKDTASIADGMERMLRSSAETRSAMSQRSSDVARQWFAMSRYLDEYEQLYKQLQSHGPAPTR